MEELPSPPPPSGDKTPSDSDVEEVVVPRHEKKLTLDKRFLQIEKGDTAAIAAIKKDLKAVHALYLDQLSSLKTTQNEMRFLERSKNKVINWSYWYLKFTCIETF